MLTTNTNHPKREAAASGLRIRYAENMCCEARSVNWAEEQDAARRSLDWTAGNTALAPVPDEQPGYSVVEGLQRHIKQDEGLFVEVGAGDGTERSITTFFERPGWNGILIESEIEKSARCMINRPQCGVLNFECVASETMEADALRAQARRAGGTRAVRGRARTLTSILQEYGIQHIDLLVINTKQEGRQVLDGLGFSEYQPSFLALRENDYNNLGLILLEKGYRLLESNLYHGGVRYELYGLSGSGKERAHDAVRENSREFAILERAWDIAARSNASYPGKYIAYYSLNVEGKQFSGERPWEERWSYIGPALREACGGDMEGKRIIEMGCNLGLLSVWAAREGAECYGYEYEADILEGSKLVAAAFEVKDRCHWQQADFNRKEVTDGMREEADVCTCLSVMNWVNNKENLIEYLSRQKVVLYEGHDQDEVEVGRLERAGFKQVRKVAVSERGRGVFLAQREHARKEMTWEEFEERYGLVGAPYHAPRVSKGDGGTHERVYLKTEIWKVRLAGEKNPAKFAAPSDEAHYLKKLNGVKGVCRLKEYVEKADYSITILEHFPNIGTLEEVYIPAEMKRKVEAQKHRIIEEVNKAGVLHNDLYDRNFLINADYDVCLIDFDQAEPADGRNDYEDGYYHRVPRPAAKDQIDEERLREFAILERAWDIAARSNASYPGKYIAYYSLNVEGKQFSGERPWEERWSYIGPALREACGGDMEGKRIIEMGCNLGLLSVWAAREGAECYGYEYEADILEGSKLVAAAFEVKDRCHWQQADFNRKEVTDGMREEADVCTCLSVMNWVNNKENLIEYLSRQKVVLYEGHDQDEVEVGRLERAGFKQVRKVAVSERGRGVFLAHKTEA